MRQGGDANVEKFALMACAALHVRKVRLSVAIDASIRRGTTYFVVQAGVAMTKLQEKMHTGAKLYEGQMPTCCLHKVERNSMRFER